MKKTLRISLVALFAAAPMMVMAADLELATASATTDTNAASAGYVKGAYNAAATAINTKQDKITDLATIRSGAAAGATALQSAGTGLTKNGTTVSIANGGVDTTQLANNAVTADKIKDSAVTSAKIAAKAVTSAKIADNTITAGQIATSGVGSDEIAANAVVAAKIATSAVTTAKIAADAVTFEKLNSTVYSKSISSASTDTEVATAKAVYTATEDAKTYAANLGSNYATAEQGAKADTALQSTSALNGAMLTDGTVSAAALATSAVTTDKIAAKAVTAAKIADNTITAGQIATSGVGSDEIAANAVIAAKIKASAVTTDKIAANAVTAAKIATSAVTSDEIADGTILVKDMSASAIKTATNTTTYSGTLLTNQGYVDEKVADATADAATKSGVKATVDAATASVSDVSLDVNFGTITTNTSGLKVSVPTTASYNIMQTWGSDSVTTGTYTLGSKSNVAVSGTATTTIGATTATGNITGIDVAVASYVAQ